MKRLAISICPLFVAVNLCWALTTNEGVIAELKRIEKTTNSAETRHDARRELIRLGDEEIINTLINDLRGREKNWDACEDAYEVLRKSRRPSIIPMVITDLADLSEVYGRRGERPIGPPHDMATFLILEIIKTSPELGDRVVAPLRIRGFDGMPQMRSSLLVWWQQNKEHFDKQDYAAVTPLQPLTNAVPQPVRSDTVKGVEGVTE